ncbi:MAG TPA: GlsB/YeaQ/YmgE family stress response membrane protein [Actinomycetales bacterium]|nr:GlsB/YeaQ/YmgE family stress response membrane protein [Actinomycetales bacterium]
MEFTVIGIIGTIIFGAVIGALARLVLPGKQNISLLMTVVLGVVGALAGYFLAGLLGVGATDGIDWIRWIISIAVAAVLVALYAGSRGRKSLSR